MQSIHLDFNKQRAIYESKNSCTKAQNNGSFPMNLRLKRENYFLFSSPTFSQLARNYLLLELLMLLSLLYFRYFIYMNISSKRDHQYYD